jgi:hypothetical protein
MISFFSQQLPFDSFALPLLGNLACASWVIDGQDEVVVVIAVESFDIHSGVGHSSGQFAELAGLVLIQALDQNFALLEDGNAGGLKRGARGGAVGEQEVGDAGAAYNEGSATFDAHARAAESFAHPGQSAGMVRQGDGQIFHGAGLFVRQNCAPEA